MESIELIRANLRRSEDMVLLRIEEMREHCMVPSTPDGGPHTLWTLGHLAYIEGLVTVHFMLGEPNPLAHWEATFDGAHVSYDPSDFPSFDETLATCRSTRARTLSTLAELTEEDLDRRSADVPAPVEDIYGTYRGCFQFMADHWLMHRGQLANARRAAGIERMWF